MFDTFDKNVIFNIFEKLESESVLEACMISSKSNRMCKDNDVIKRLLDAHYPNAYYTRYPWRQYVALASNVYTFYKTINSTLRIRVYRELGSTINVLKPERSIPVRAYQNHHYPSYHSKDGEIWVHGLPVPNGEKLWILYFETEDTEIHSFKTKEALADWVIDDTYDMQLNWFLNDYDNKQKLSINKVIHNYDFIEIMKKYITHNGNPIDELAIPFTKENYHKSIMNNITIDMFFNWDCIYMDHVQF